MPRSVRRRKKVYRLPIVRKRVGTPFPSDLSAAVVYNLEDQIGSSVTRLNTSGAVIDKEEYYPFGDSSLRTFSSKRYRYVGKEKDQESGLYYYGARYYAAWTCRFISVDPAKEQRAWLTPYNYVQNKPINLTDPTGALDDGGGGGDPIKKGDIFVGDDGKSYTASVDEVEITGINGDQWTVDKSGKGKLLNENGKGIYIDGVSIQDYDFSNSPDLLSDIAKHYGDSWSALSVDLVFPAISKDIVNNGMDRFIKYFDDLGEDYFFNHIKTFDIDFEAHGPTKTALAKTFPAVMDAMHITAWRDDVLHPTHRGTAEGNELEHRMGTFLMESRYGLGGFGIVMGNEIFNLSQDFSRGGGLMNGGIGEVLRALGGATGTAFEWKDIKNNLVGDWDYFKYYIFGNKK